MAIKDIGPVVAQSLYVYFHAKQNLDLIAKLFKNGVTITLPPRPSALPLTGKSFVLTGTLATLSREEAKERIRALGGEVSESISKKTSYVVVGETPGSKFEKAKKLNIAILNETEFLKLLK